MIHLENKGDKTMTFLRKTSLLSFAFFLAHMPKALAQSGIFDEGTDKGNQLLEEFIDGPARLIAGVAIIAAIIFFFMGKLPLKMLALIVTGGLLLSAYKPIIDFIFG